MWEKRATIKRATYQLGWCKKIHEPRWWRMSLVEQYCVRVFKQGLAKLFDETNEKFFCIILLMQCHLNWHAAIFKRLYSLYNHLLFVSLYLYTECLIGIRQVFVCYVFVKSSTVNWNLLWNCFTICHCHIYLQDVTGKMITLRF